MLETQKRFTLKLEDGEQPPKPQGVGLVKIITAIVLVCIFLGMWFLYNELYVAEAQSIDEVNFVVEKNESISHLAGRLEDQQIIRNPWLFKKYLIFKGIDKRVQAGDFKVIYPITLVRVASALKTAIVQDEKTITIIPGWDLRDLADYLKNEKLIDNEEQFFGLVGKSAVLYKNNNAPSLNYQLELLEEKPRDVSYEGYLAPDTYRIFKDASVEDVIKKLLFRQAELISEEMYTAVKSGEHTMHEILTMASILEREVKTPEEKAMVADIFWRRLDKKWALQADSTVHYAVNKRGDVFTTKEDRNSDNPWNTYQYPGLPPGPICNPSLESIKAAIYPTPNNYWYFLTAADGEVKYAEDLAGHNANVQKYLQ